MKKKILIIISIILSIIIIITTTMYYKYYKPISNTNQPEEDNQSQIQMKDSDLNISQETKEKSKENNIENLLILGIDKQENASDTIDVLSLNRNNKTAKLTSIMRDTYVYFGDNMANKINYAYHYGGVPLTISKLNELFQLDISKYIKVDFEGLINTVDTLGGITISITDEERAYINGSCKDKYLDKSGEVLLNGEQTLVFSRLRKIDSDFQRTARHRKILFAIFRKLKDVSITDYNKIYSEMSPYIETNLSAFEIIKFGLLCNKLGAENLQDFRIPIDGTTKDNTNGVYHLDWDKDKNTEALHKFIYGDAQN
ncbi:LCP family protein [Clostridium sp. SHJSY1]|uniref:LCP family protein n=1 Tax=Clostridium sp. SHJSY1 TaxID=2942483 RepID=UPI0028754E13|nr:LCP family protein [Clostridium sp. SHJSY1]MDS0526541.1 LCP family protein [Clostridium sp. SHJSY1]